MTLRTVGLLRLTLGLLWCSAPTHALEELVNKKADDVLGQLSRHSRAIACTNGGSFESINAVSADGTHTTGLTICCTAGSTVWWEGLQDAGPQCAEFGAMGGGATTTASCAPQSSVQAIHFDGDRDVNALQGLPWAQFCDTDKCGIKAGALAVGCYNPTNAQSQPVQQPLLDKLDCPADQVVEVIYAHWNELSIQSLDAVTCRPVYTAVAPNDPIFTTGCESGGDTATAVDLRCHGSTSDVCGCIKVPAISNQPYFGCVMSGYTTEDSMPAVTLPGVVDAAPQPDCQVPDRMKRFLPRAIWPRMEDEEGNCLTANNAEEATWEACVDDTLLSSQGWRLIAFTADQGIDALESLQFPGSCAVLGADLEVSLCSCSQVALSVANKGIVFGADGVATVPDDADEEEEPEEEDTVETPGAVAPAVPTDPEEAPEDYAEEEPEGDPPVEPPVDAEPEDPEEEIPIEDYAVPPDEEEPVDPGDDFMVEPPAETDEEMAAEPPLTPPEEAPVDEAGAEAGAEADFDAAMAPEAARRRRSLLEALPVPLGECPTGAVASWQQTYNKKTVNPHAQFKIYQAAESLVKAVESGGGLPTATLMGAPEFGVIKTLEVGEEFDPVRVCSWKYVLCGAEEILQVVIVGGAGTIPPEITNVQGLKGIAVAGDGDAEGGEPAPALDLQGKAQVVALHVQSTSMTGRVPCSWGDEDLMYLGVVGNKAMSGPLPTCFAQTNPDIMINISENDPENPFCGSRSQQNPIAKQIPKCSNLDSVPEFPGTPVSLTLEQEEECSKVAEKFQTFVETKMGFMMDVTDVSCPGASVDPGSGRRLLQAGPTTLNTDLSGPLADSTLKQALTADDPGQLYNALQEDVGEVSAVSVDAPDLPQDDSIATLAPGADPVDVDGGKSGSNRNTLTIILIACVVVAVVLFAIVGALFCRARSRKRQQQEVGSLKPNTAATYVSVDASITQNSADFSGAVPPPDPIMAVKPPQQRNSMENRNPSFGAPVVAPAPNIVPVPGMPFQKGPETAKSSAWGTHTQAFAASAAFLDSDLPTAAARKQPSLNASTPTNGGVVSTMPRPPLSATSNDNAMSNVSPGEGGAGGAVAPMPQSSEEIDESEMLNTGEGSMISRSLSKVRTSGNARRGGKEATPTLPSSANNYPHSEELAKMSSREIHRRMRSPEVSGSRRAKAGDDSESATPGTGGPSSSKNATNTPTSKPKSVEEEPSERPSNPVAPAAVAERPAMGYLAAAVAGTGAATGAGAAAIANPRSTGPSPPTSVNEPGAGAAAEAARVREAYAALNAEAKSDHPVSVETMEEKNGIHLKAAKRRVGAVGGISEPASPDDFSMRVGNTWAMGFTGDLSQADVDGGVSQTVKGGPAGDTGDVDSPDSKGGVSVSSFKSVSVMSESTTVYTDIGNKDTEGDAMTKLEQVLNRVQRELGGQVGSFRLKGIRHRFTGRSSLVAFADGMWGGEFALKFYSDVEAAQTEFAIYRQAEDLHMALPPVQEIEDNTGGVLRLKDGTPLPPYLAMPRGLPLPDWYAMHRPRQVATLAMLAQLVYRLEKLHVSGYCHNDIKPANMVLLDGGNTKKPEWHIVDFTNMSQIGSNTRARYTLEYASPEVIRAVGAMRAHYVTCQPSMDVWSMGVICFEVLTSKPFFPMDYNREAMKDGLIGLEPLPVEEEPALFSKIPAEGKLRATVKMMLSRDTEKRPSANAIGKAIADCLKELTGEAPEPLDASPVSSLMRDDSTAGI